MELKAFDLTPAVSGDSNISIDSCKSARDTDQTAIELSVHIEPETVGNQHKISYTRISIVLLVLLINIIVFADGFYVFEDIEYAKDSLKTTLSVMSAHLVIEHVFENVICSLKAEHMILYSSTACIRDIINNIAMTLFYIFDDYGYWWKPMMWGCYMSDLVMLLSKWKYFRKSWLKFVLAHHFCVAIMIIILNHTTKVLTGPSLVCLIVFMNSNTPGCASPIWKAFKLPLYKYSTIICFVIQRIVRIAAFLLAARVKSEHFLGKDYYYVVLVVFAVALDIWDIYSQINSICRYYQKQIKSTSK